MKNARVFRIHVHEKPVNQTSGFYDDKQNSRTGFEAAKSAIITPMIKRWFVSLFQAVRAHNLGSLAAVISFFGFSSLIPLILLLIYGASLLIPEASVERFLQGLLQAYLPAIPTGGEFAWSTISRLTHFRAGVGIIGVFGLLWTTVGGFVTLQQILDTIFEVHERRSFLFQYVIGFAMLGILMGLTIVSSLITFILPNVAPHLAPAYAASWTLVVHSVAKVSFPFILFVTCFFVYRVLPSKRLPSIPLLIGAALSTLCIYASRELFVLYTHHLGRYQLLYGTLTFVMLLTFWIYIVSMVLLLGAEVVASILRVRQRAQEPASNVKRLA
ncbi:YihY/virulence factor BrkB family protein [Alicyclobacillus tolerans]|uniref:YihY/virulence factor BrkB family protein n=1 Tax=Alicyclobacillus tolerans TaxID=90970 RepID=UPI001F3E112E|nr:YihY/virulence factor BrkB family protein [Alicyclobacillus tolerans]MCF8563358.1 YihY/virulence factor BrkB family protein [Alicyclobacillus tolerans]